MRAARAIGKARENRDLASAMTSMAEEGSGECLWGRSCFGCSRNAPGNDKRSRKRLSCGGGDGDGGGRRPECESD